MTNNQKCDIIKTTKKERKIHMNVIKTNEKAYPVKIEDAWDGTIYLTPGDIPKLIKELTKIQKEREGK